VLGGLAIKFFGVLWIDPLITLLVSAYIIYEAYKITVKSIDILMQSSADMDYEALQKDMENIKEVKNIHHVHTWLADEKTIFFEAHIEVKEDLKVSELDGVYRDINHLLKEHYGVEHTTIQIEGNLCEDKELFKL
jgi:cobalt-zinc-cadmium efflux system protein